MTKRVELRKVTCPSCGAPVEMTGMTGRCDYCGALLERDEPLQPEGQPEAPVQVHVTQWPVTPAPVYTAAQPSAAGLAGCLGAMVIPIIVLIVIGGVVAYLVFQASSGASSLLEGFDEVVATALPAAERNPWTLSNGSALLLVAGDGLAPDALVSGYHPFENRRGLLYLEGEGHRLRWASEPIEVTNTSPLIAGATTIYVAGDNSLYAINRADGTTAWQATLTDLIYDHICHDCLQLIGDSVVALSQDGTLQAFDAASGQLRWSQTLNEQPRQLLNVNGRIGVYDKEEADGEVDLFLYDVNSGDVTQRLSPRCPNEPFPSSPQGPGIYYRVFQSAADNALYFLGGFFEPGCVQRWDAGSGTVVWESVTPVEMVRSFDEGLLTREALYLSDGEAILAINLNDGSQREVLAATPDYEVAPLGVQGGLLLVKARRMRGTQRDELWAVDARTGERRWQFTPQATDILEDYDIVYGSEQGLWTWQGTTRGVLLVQARPEPARLVLETLQLQDGVSSGQATTPLDEEGQYSIEVLGWVGERGWLNVDGRLVVVDAGQNAIVSSWP